MSFIRKITCYALLILSVFSAVPTPAVAKEDRVTVNRDVVFRRGEISASVRGRISRGTTHLYRVRARRGAPEADDLPGNKPEQLYLDRLNPIE